MCSLFLCLEIGVHCSWSCSLILFFYFGNLLLCSLFPCSLFVFCSSFFHLVLAFCLLSCVCCPSSFSSFFVIGFGSCSGAFFFCCSYKCYHYYVSVVFLLCFPFSLCILFLYWPSFLIGI